MANRGPSLQTGTHTLVVSDIHLSDLEPPHPTHPLWKKFKSSEFFIDRTFVKFLETIQEQARAPIELILNGDIFDFDCVMALPKNSPFRYSWLEERRGLNSEEEKSLFKIQTILGVHSVWVDAVKRFLANGNTLVFVIGNHDIELHWPKVQNEIKLALGLPHDQNFCIRFAEWFYLSQSDTLIEHGNQYDSYSLCMNPINPYIKKNHQVVLRIPFGNLAGKYLVNGMGLMNPHSEGSYIKASIWEYARFFYEYVLKTQPFILWSWFWGSFVTLWVTLTEGFHPALRDAVSIGDRIDEIADKANASPKVVLALRELHAHPACFNPVQLVRELWLDRAILFLCVMGLSFQTFLFFNLFTKASIWFLAIPFTVLFPAFVFYARSIRSGVESSQLGAFESVPIAAQISNVKRVIHGHTHIAKHCMIKDIEYLNTGTWAPAFYDVECTQPYGKRGFVWIKPRQSSEANRSDRTCDCLRDRVSELYEWKRDETYEKVETTE